MHKCRVLVLSSTYPRWYGDNEPAFVHELSKRLVGTYDITEVAPHYAGAKFYEKLDGVTVIRFRYAPDHLEKLAYNGGIIGNLKKSFLNKLLLPVFLIAQALVYKKLLKSYKFDVVHVHWIIPQGLIYYLVTLFYKSRVPLIITSHGSDLTKLNSIFLLKLKRKIIASSDKICVVSNALKIKLEELGVSKGKIEVAPMGVDLISRFRLESEVARQKNRFLFIGRLVEGKGLNTLIAAFSRVLLSYPDLILDIVGGGPKKNEYKNLVVKLGIDRNVFFHGSISNTDIPIFYQKAGLFIFPTEVNEGLGLVSIEAMGCGCPVLMSDYPAAEDIYTNIENITTFTPGSEAELYEKMLLFLESDQPSKESILRDRQQLEDRYDWEKVARRYSNIYEELINSERVS